jgi:hypothetical protein
MSCLLPRLSVVVLTAVLLLGGSPARSDDADDMFGPDPAPAVKPEPKKKRNAMLTVLRALERNLHNAQPPAEDMFADPFGADAPAPVAKPAPAKPRRGLDFGDAPDTRGPKSRSAEAAAAPSTPMPPPLPFNVRPRIIWPSGETAAERPAAVQDPFLEPDSQPIPEPRAPEGDTGERKPEAPPRYRQSQPLRQSETPLVRSARVRIEAALNQPTELELYESPLEEVVNLLKELHRIEIQIDKKALDDVGIATDTLITKSLKGITLRSALNLMLHELDLTWMIKDEVLLITTPEVTDSLRYLETYDVSDLIGLGDEKGGPAAAGKRLTETLAATMPLPDDGQPGQKPDDRKNARKPGPIACSTFGTVTILSATQNCNGHEHIAQWLADVRGTLAEQKPAAEPKKKRGKPSAEAVILKALKKKVSVDYIEESLEDVVTDLQDKCNINIQIDKKALDDVGIRTDTPITKRLKDISLRSALRLMLHELDLTYMIKDEVLLITTPEVADQLLTTKFYDVADLVVCRNKKGELWDDYESLTDAIAATVLPNRWDSAGGSGSITGKTYGGTKVVIVSSTPEVHAEIVDFLANLRAVAQKYPNAPPPRREPPPPKPPAGSPAGMGGGMF